MNMNILIVFAIPCYMATVARGAPSQERGALEDPMFLRTVQSSKNFATNILRSIPEVLKSIPHRQSPTRTGNAGYLSDHIGMPPAPQLEGASESVSWATRLTRMSDGLRRHLDLLATVFAEEPVEALLVGLQDLVHRIDEILEMEQREARAPWTPTHVALNLTPRHFATAAEVITLERLQSFVGLVVERLGDLERERSRGATL